MRLLLRVTLLRGIFKPLLKYILGVRFDSPDEFTKHKQYIIVANHNSHLDTTAILCSLPIRRLNHVYPMAAEDYFTKNKFVSFFVHYFYNVATIDRKKGQTNPLEKFEEMLNEGKSIIMFPEGSRGAPDQLSSFKRGIGILLSKYPHVGYIPIYAENFGKIMPKGDGLLVPHDAHLKIGSYTKANSTIPDEITDEVYQKVKELQEL